MRALPEPIRSVALAERLGGTHHGPEQLLHSVSTPAASVPGCLSFALRPKPTAGCVLVRERVAGTCIVVPDPKASFIQILGDFEQPQTPTVHPTAQVPAQLHPSVSVGAFAVLDDSAVIGQHAVIHAGVVVGAGCHVGPRTVLHPRVVLYPRVRVGADCVIHAGAVLGGPGFGLHPDAQGQLQRIPHVGELVLQERVHIGANCTIDRALLERTLIQSGVQIDNQVHIGHNAVIGRGSVIAAQSGLSGSVTLEPGVVLGGQVGVVDHVRIGAGARVGAGSGVMRDVASGTAVLGSPADRRVRTLRRWAALLKER